MSKTIKNIGITFVIGCGVFVLGSFIFNGGLVYDNSTEFLINFIIYQIYTFSLNYVNTECFRRIEKIKFSGYATIKHILFGAIGSTVVTLITIFLIRLGVALLIKQQSFSKFIYTESWNGYSFGLWITLSIVSVFYGIYYYNKFQKNRIKEQKVIAGVASARFDALKNQLDPHFLFNSLNVLTSLIEENPVAAQKFTTSLSKVYRYVLEQKNKELVTVDEELRFAKTYMSLLKMRFEESIIFEMPQKASDPESKVVPLSLQLLLENAVKHNMVTSKKPLKIRIYEDNGYLVVQNNLQPKQIVKKSSGVGLDNIKQRFQLLTNKTVLINKRDRDFAVAIPMLTKQITIMRTIQQNNSANKLNDDYMRAHKKVDELKGFYYSLISYVFVIPFLVFIWYRYSSYTIQWFWFPAFGWGLSLVIQAYRVFVDNGAFGSSWEKRKIEEYMRKEEESRKRF